MELQFQTRWIVPVVVFATFIELITARGRMLEPSQRSSLWRHGYDSPINRDDDGLNCGGYWHQWQINGGKCGICGDPYDVIPRQNEAGGKFARGIITRTYNQNSKYIDTVIEVKKNMKGYFEFRLCTNVRISSPVTQQCLDENVLDIDGHGKRFYPKQNGMVNLRLAIPPGIQCKRCVLQWKWHTAMNWGKCADGSGSKMGCGDQEEFYNCADIAIVKSESSQSGTTVSVPKLTTLQRTKQEMLVQVTTEPIVPIFDFLNKSELKKSDVEKFVSNKMASNHIQTREERTSLLSDINLKRVPKVEGIILPFLGDKPTGAASGTKGKKSNDVKDSYSIKSDILNRFKAVSEFTTRRTRTTRSVPDTSTMPAHVVSVRQRSNVGSLMGSNVGILTVPDSHVTVVKKTASSSGVLSGPRTVDHSNAVISGISVHRSDNTNERFSKSITDKRQEELAINKEQEQQNLDKIRGKPTVDIIQGQSLSDRVYTQPDVDMVQVKTSMDRVKVQTVTDRVKAQSAPIPVVEQPAVEAVREQPSITKVQGQSVIENLKEKAQTETTKSQNDKSIVISYEQKSKSETTGTLKTISVPKSEAKIQNITSTPLVRNITISTSRTSSITKDNQLENEMPNGQVIDVNRLRKIVQFIKKNDNADTSIQLSGKQVFGSKGKKKFTFSSFDGTFSGRGKSGNTKQFKALHGPSSISSMSSDSVEKSETQVTKTNMSQSTEGIPIPMQGGNNTKTTTTIPNVETTTGKTMIITTEKESNTPSKLEKSREESSSILSHNAVIAGMGSIDAAFDSSHSTGSLSLSTGLGGTMNIAGGSLSAMQMPGLMDNQEEYVPKETTSQSNTRSTTPTPVERLPDAISQNGLASKSITDTVSYNVQGQKTVHKGTNIVIETQNVAVNNVSKTKHDNIVYNVKGKGSEINTLDNVMVNSKTSSSVPETSVSLSSSDTFPTSLSSHKSLSSQQKTQHQEKIENPKTDATQKTEHIIGNKMANTAIQPMTKARTMKETHIITDTISETSVKNEFNTVKSVGTTLPPQTIPSTFAPKDQHSSLNEGEHLLSKPILIKGSFNIGASDNQWQTFPNDQANANIASTYVDQSSLMNNGQAQSNEWLSLSNNANMEMNNYQSMNMDTGMIGQNRDIMTPVNEGVIPLPPGEIAGLTYGSDMPIQPQQPTFDPTFAGLIIGSQNFNNVNQNNINQAAEGGALSHAFDGSISQTGMDHTLLIADSPTYDPSYGPLLSSSGKSGLDASASFAFVTLPPAIQRRKAVTTTTPTTTTPTTTTLPTTTLTSTSTTTSKPTTTTTMTSKPLTVPSTTIAVTVKPTEAPVVTTQATTPIPVATSPIPTTRAPLSIISTTQRVITTAEPVPIIKDIEPITTKLPPLTTADPLLPDSNFIESMFKALAELMMNVKSEQAASATTTPAINVDTMAQQTNVQVQKNADKIKSPTVSTSEAFQQDVQRDRINKENIQTNVFDNTMNNNYVNIYQHDMRKVGIPMPVSLLPHEKTTASTTTQPTTTTTLKPVTDALISGLSGLMPGLGGMNRAHSQRTEMNIRGLNVQNPSVDYNAQGSLSMNSNIDSGTSIFGLSKDNPSRNINLMDTRQSSSIFDASSVPHDRSTFDASNVGSRSSTFEASSVGSHSSTFDASSVGTGSSSFGANGIGLSDGNIMQQNHNSGWTVVDTSKKISTNSPIITSPPPQYIDTGSGINIQTPPSTSPQPAYTSLRQTNEQYQGSQSLFQEPPPTYAPTMTTVAPSINNQFDASLFGTGTTQKETTRSNDAAWGLGQEIRESNTNILLTTGGSGKGKGSSGGGNVWESLAAGSNPLDFAAVIQKTVSTPAPMTTTLTPTTPMPLIDVNDLTPQSVDPVNREVTLSMIKSMAKTKQSLYTILYATAGDFLNSMGIDPLTIKGSTSTAVLNILPELRRVMRLPPRRNYPKTPYIPGSVYDSPATSVNTSAASTAPVEPVPTPDPVQRTVEAAMAKQMLTMLGLVPEAPEPPARGRGGRRGRGEVGFGADPFAADPWAATDPYGAGGGFGGGPGADPWAQGGRRPAGRTRQISRAWQEVLGMIPEPADVPPGQRGGGMGMRGGFGGGRGRGGGMGEMGLLASAFMDPAEARELGLLGGGRGRGRGGGGFGGGPRGGRRQQAAMDAMVEAFGF